MTKYESRQHAINGYRNAYGRHLREMSSATEMREMIRRGIDLADLPAALADRLAHSDRAWSRFINDIIRAAKAWPSRESAPSEPMAVACPVCEAAPSEVCVSMAARYVLATPRTSSALRKAWRTTPHRERVLAARAKPGRYTRGTKVAITETEHEKLAQPEIATVFEDYGQSHVNVMRANGQLHAVPRSSMSEAK